MDCAGVQHSISSIGVLSILTPDDILRLRAHGESTIFSVEVVSDASPQEIERTAITAIHTFWGYACEYFEKNYREYTLEKNKARICLESNLRYEDIAKQGAEISSSWSTLLVQIPIFGELTKSQISELNFRFFYKETNAWRELRHIRPRLWTPSEAW